MLAQFAGHEISEHWEWLKPQIEEMIPHVDGMRLDYSNVVLTKLLSGEMQCWASYIYDDKQEQTDIGMVILTMMTTEMVTGVKDILIYGLNLTRGVGKREWNESVQGLARWAKASGCRNLTAYTKNKKLLAIGRMYKGEVNNYVVVNLVNF